MRIVEIKTEERVVEVEIPKWDMRKVLEKQNSVLPLIKAPMASVLAVGDEMENDPGLAMAALFTGVVDALTSQNVFDLCQTLLDGTYYRNKNGVKKELVFKSFEEEGMDISDLYLVLFEIIKENYSPLLKGGFQKIMASMMGAANLD